MRRKAKKATPEETKRFEEDMRSRTEGGRTGTACSGERLCLDDFSWLDDAVLASLSFDDLLSVSARYRDIITGMREDMELLTGAFRKVLERNNILITDIFGRKSEKLTVLLGGSRAAGSHGREDDGSDEEDAGETEPVRSSDGDVHTEPVSSDGNDGSTEESGSGQDDTGGTGQPEKTGRGWKPRRSAGCLNRQCRNVPVIERTIEITEDELEKIFGKGNYRRMESNDREIVEYEYIPRTVYVRKTILCAYEAVDKEDDQVRKEMAVAPNPVMRLRQNSRTTSSIVAHFMHERFLLRLPWERVSSGLERDGLALPPQMMEENARFYYGLFTAVIQRMWYWLFLTGHIQIDETPVLMYDQTTKVLYRRYFWVFTVSELYSTEKTVTIFVYAEGKDTGVLRKYLVQDHKYSGYTTTDGHEPYHIIEKETGGAIRNTGCLNHFRTRLARVLKAIPGLKNMPEEQLRQIPAYNALSGLQVVFRNEKETAGMSAEERTAYRLKYVMPELEKAFGVLAGLEADDYGQGSLMYKALTYRDNQQEYLKRFIEDGSIPLSNANSERRIAFLALIRNVSRYFGSDVMGKTGAGWETLTQTAKAHTDHVDIYFQYLLDEAVPFIRSEDSRKAVGHTARSSLEELEERSLSYFNDQRMDRFMTWSPEYRAYEAGCLKRRRDTAELLAGARENSRR